MSARHKHATTKYAESVLSGEILACKWVKLACQRHIKDGPENHDSVEKCNDRGLWFDHDAGDRIIAFFRDFLVMYEGDWDGKPFLLEPFQKFIVGSLFGWKTADGSRRFRTAYIEMAKGQGKSPLAAGVGLYGLVPDGESGAEIYCLTPEARILYDDLTWRPIGDARVGDRLIGVDEYPETPRHYRKMRRSTVIDVRRQKSPCLKIDFTNGASVTCTPGHRWYVKATGKNRLSGWAEARLLHVGRKVRWLARPWKKDESRDAGYLSGIFDGEGCFHAPRSERAAFRIILSQKPGAVFSECVRILKEKGFEFRAYPQSKGSVWNAEVGGLPQVFRVLGELRPLRFLGKNGELWEGKTPNRNGWATVSKITEVGETEVVDIETTTGTYFAEGLFSHNSAATTRDQAGILFRDAKAFAEGSPALMRRLTVDKGNIAYAARNSYFRPVSSEHRGLDGKRPHIALIDEIHEHPNAMVVDKMRAGTKGRRQALIFEITNAGYDRHSVCYQHHEYSEKILEGVIENDAWFAYMAGLDVCEACAADGKSIPTDGCPDCDSWKDESTWVKANPGLDVIIPRKYLREQVAEATEMPSKENIVKRLNFCIWTESVTKWLSMDRWNACGDAVDAEALRGRTCYGGLDLSSVSDVTAWVLVFPPEKIGGKYSVLCRFFLPEDNMRERVRRDKVPYDVWARQGFITLTPGNIIDYEFVLAAIKKDAEDFEVAELAFDRWGSQKITTDLQDLGFEVEGKKSLIQFGQGFASMAAPTKELEKMVGKGEIAHGGNPVLSWMVSNAVVRSDPAGNIKVDKEKSTERVDGVVALVMGLSRAMLQNNTTSVYESRGVLTFQ